MLTSRTFIVVLAIAAVGAAALLIYSNLVSRAIETGYQASIVPASLQKVVPRLTFRVPADVPADTKPIEQPKWELPILMYHYVRVVDPAEDPLGYRLSVSIEQLNEELDHLRDNGYQTVDLLSTKPLPPKSVLITFDDGYADFYTAAWPALKAHGDGAVAFIVAGFLGKDGYLTKEQVKELAADGVAIGAHTLSHPNLTTQSPEDLAKQLAQPKATLETLIGRSVPIMAYPSGKYNDTVIAATKAAGYTIGMSTHFGLATNLDDHLAFRRIEVIGGDPIDRFADKLEGLARHTGPVAPPVDPGERK